MNPTQAEEISTIFVVGFPDDMQVRHIITLSCLPSLKSPWEREFQNMFKVAAPKPEEDVKIPSKEPTSYNAPNTAFIPVDLNTASNTHSSAMTGSSLTWPPGPPFTHRTCSRRFPSLNRNSTLT